MLKASDIPDIEINYQIHSVSELTEIALRSPSMPGSSE